MKPSKCCKTNISPVYAMILCGAIFAFVPSGKALAADGHSANSPSVLTGGVKGEATLKPSLKVIQPEESPKVKTGRGGKGTADNSSSSGSWTNQPGSYFDSEADWRLERKRLRKLNRQNNKHYKNSRGGHWQEMTPVSSYKHKKHYGTVSTPGNTYAMDSSERADLLWIKSLANGILKDDRSFLPRFADPDSALKREKRRLKQEKRRKMRGYSVYSKKRQQFMSAGYSLSYSYGELKESSLGGRWYVPEEKRPVPMIARAGRLTDPIFAQPVIFQPAGSEAALRASAGSVGLVWSDWYRKMARAIYDNWEQTEIGPGLARVRITVNENKQITARVVDFKPAPYVSRDPTSEVIFRQAALKAVRQLNLREVPAFPVSGKNKVVFEVEMRRVVDGPAGIEIAMSDEDQIDQIMNMVDQMSPRDQRAIYKKFAR